MNWDQIKGDWYQLSRGLKEKWNRLTEDDLTMIAGRREQLELLLQKHYGFDKEQVGIELDQFAAGLCS
jgi:uncharacterized protein YjbJ (UPF0337 family)